MDETLLLMFVSMLIGLGLGVSICTLLEYPFEDIEYEEEDDEGWK